MTPPRFGALGALALSILLILPAAALGQEPPDLPAGPGRVIGRVVHAATGDPVPDVEVVLYALTSEGVPGLRRARSDAGGGFVFEGISNASGISYLLGGRYSGVPFPGARVSFADGETEASADVRLTDLTRDPAAIRPAGVEIRVARDAQGLRVLQRVELLNEGDMTYAVAADARGNARPAFSASLPPGATGFKMPLGVIPDGIAREGDRVDYYGPIYPGPHDLSFSFSLSGERDEDGNDRFVLEGTLPAETPLVVLIPEGLGPGGAPGLERDPEPQLADGRPHVRFSGTGETFRIEISPPPAVIDPSAVRVTEVQAVLDADDAAISVRETVTIEVSGSSVILGTEAEPLLRLLLPDAARDLRFGTDAAGTRLIPHPDGGLATIGTAGPGTWRVEVRYQLAVDTLPIRFSRHYTTRVPRLSILIADTGEWVPSSGRLHKRRPVRTPDLAYMHLEAFEVEPHETVSVSLDRLPPRSRSERTIGLAAAGGLALMVIFWLSVPLRAASRTLDDPESISALHREREAVIWSIRDLDHDFETGKISEADHREMRDSLRSRAVELLRQERTEQSADAPTQEPAADPAAACTACGAGLETGHRFCARCGAPRAATPTPAPTGTGDAGS